MIGAILRSFWTRLILTVGVLGYLLSRMDVQDVGSALLNADPVFLLLTLLLVAADRFVMAWRWLLLLRSAGAEVSFRLAVEIFFVSSFLGSFLPAGVGADISRAYAIAAQTGQRSDAVASVAVDRLAGMTAIALLGIAGVIAWGVRTEDQLARAAIAGACLTAGIVLAVFWSDWTIRLVVQGRWRTSDHGSRLLRLADAVARYRTRKSALGWVLSLSVVVQLLRILQAYCLGVALGIGVGLSYYLVFMPVALLLLLLPISISGFGMPQGAIVWLLQPVGVPPERSFALSTLIILSAFVGNLPGAWLYLKERKR